MNEAAPAAMPSAEREASASGGGAPRESRNMLFDAAGVKPYS